MPVEIRHSGETVTVVSAASSVVAQGKRQKVEASSYIRIGGGDPYTGSYEVTPSEEEQVLRTASCVLGEDVKVNPIPSNYGLITWDGTSLHVS